MQKMTKDEILAEVFGGKRVRATSWDEHTYIEAIKGRISTNEDEAFNIMDAKENEWVIWVEPVEKSGAVISKDEALKALYSGERVRSAEWIASFIELVDGQVVDEKGNPYNMMSAKVEEWVVWTKEATGVDESSQIAELKDMMEQLLKNKGNNETSKSQSSTPELLLDVYGVIDPADIEEQFKEKLESANSSRDVQSVVCEYIPYCWIGGRALNTSKQYYTKMRNIIKDSTSEHKDMALAIFLPPAKLYESLKEKVVTSKKEKMADDSETFSIKHIEDVISKLQDLIEGGEEAILSTKSRQFTIERATAYVYATYLALVTGRRQSEILKTLKIANRKGTWFYDGILKNGKDGKSIEAYALNGDFELLQKLLTYVQEHLKTEELTPAQVNSKFNSPFNNALKRLIGTSYSYKEIREIYSEMMWLKNGNNGSWKDREEYKAKILGHKYDAGLSTPEHYMGLKGV